MSASWRSLVVAVATITAAAVVIPSAIDDTRVEAATQPSRFVPVEPCRVLDTRESGRLTGAGSSLAVPVVGRCGVGPEAVAAAITITAVDPTGAGYLTVFPSGFARPATAALNYRRNDTIANLQLVQLGGGGRVMVYAHTATHVVIDVTGYFEPAAGGQSASGRFVSVDAHRLLDTRRTGQPAPRSSVRVRPDVPSDAIAVAVSVTTTATRSRGYFVAHAAGTARPLASMLNVDAQGQTRTGSAIVAIGPGGFDVYTLAGDHVIVDITGYFTGPDAPVSSDGLFVGIVPTRLVDTRNPAAPSGGPRLWDRGTREFAIRGLTGDAAAVVANVVATNTEDRGHVIAYPARTNRPLISTVNYDRANSTVASSSIVATSGRGIAVYARDATHLVVDVSGWFLGAAQTATAPAPRNDPPADRRVTIISDSAAAGIRWNGALGGLRGFVADARLESCRRLVQPSCNGREGYNPRTVVSEIGVLPPADSEAVLVIATGYNDWHERFAADFDAVIAAARRKGFHHIAWIDYRTQVGYTLPGSSLRSNYAAMNAILTAKVASGAYPEVRIWSLNSYTAFAPGWFYPDGVHERRLGSWGVADWISRHVRAFDDRPCVMPWFVGAPVDDPCRDPDGVVAQRGVTDIATLYQL